MNQGNRSDLLGSINTDKNEGSSPWILHFDDENQAHYYFNAQTGECKWAEVTQSNPTEHSEYYPEGGDTAEYDFDEIDGESVSNMSRISTMSVVERSEQMLAHKREKQEALRYQLQQRELEGLRSGPEINQRSKQLNRKVDDIFAWEDKRKAKLEMLAAQVRMEEDSQITGRPHLYAPMISSGASVCSSFNSVISTGSGSEGLSVEERLLAYEEKRKLKLQQTIAHEQNEARKAATPTLAPHSANLNRSRVAHSYSNASTSDSQNSSQYGGSYLGRGTADGTAPGILKDNSTGQIMFQVRVE